jgi:hypothetical protein
VTSAFFGQEHARRGFAVTGGNAGTGGCSGLQSAKCFSSCSFIGSLRSRRKPPA